MKHMILFSLRGLIVLGGGVVQSGEQIHRDHRERRGVVETVRDVQSEGGRTTGAGVIIGAVVGAVAGSHIGSGRGDRKSTRLNSSH